MLLLEADCHTGVLSGRCKIKKKKSCFSLHVSSFKTFHNMENKKKSCFQFYFSPFKTFFIGIMNVQDSSLQRKERCRVYYPNVKQVVILWSVSWGCYSGPERWASKPTTWQGAPWNVMTSIRQNKAGFTGTCRTRAPFTESVPLPLTLPSPRENTVTASRPRAGHLTLHTITSAGGRKPSWISGVLRQKSFQVQTHTG